MSGAEQIPLMPEVGDPQARREDDFYATRRWQIQALLRRVRISIDWLVFEPAAGDGAIAKPLIAQHCTVLTNDIVRRDDFPLDFMFDATDEANWQRLVKRKQGAPDLSLTNVPFSLAFEMVRLMRLYSRVGAISLLRSTFDEPTEERGDWLKANPPTAQIAMPRAHYRGGSGGDSATHHWFIWSNLPGFPGFHHETVTIAERDELVRIYGGPL